MKIKSWELDEDEMLETEHYEQVQVKQSNAQSRSYSKYTGDVCLETL